LIEELAGAGERFRTVDLVLGKHTLYQLSYTRPARIEEPVSLIVVSPLSTRLYFEGCTLAQITSQLV
jgi:hypothetical protein